MFKFAGYFPEKFLLKAVRYGLFFSIFTPLILFRVFWSPTNFGKLIVFRVLIEIISALWLFLLIKNPKYRPRLNMIGWAFLLFIASYLISGFFGANWGWSFWGGFERMGGAFNLFHYFIFFLILMSVFKNRDDWLMLLHLSLAAGLFSILYGFLQLSNWKFILGALPAGARSRIFGTIGNPAMFAGFLIFIIYIALFLLLGEINNGKSRKSRWFYCIAMGLSITALVMTAVRGAILALLISLLGFFFWYFFLNKVKKDSGAAKIIFAFALLVFLILLGLVLTHHKIPLVYKISAINRLSTVSFSQTTVQQRLLVWKEALTGLKARPLLGWGPENFTIVHQKYYEPRTFFGQAGSLFDRPHNIFLEILATQGASGFLMYLLLYLALAFALKKRYSKFPVAVSLLSSLFVAYFIQGFFFFDTFSIYLMLSMIMALISNGSIFSSKTDDISRTAEASEKQSERQVAGRIIFAASFSIFIGLVIYYFSVLPAIANNLSAKAAISFSENNYELGMRQWKKSLAYKLPTSYAADIRLNVQPVYMDALYKLADALPKNMVSSDLDYLIGESQKGIEVNHNLVENYMALDTLYVAYAGFIDSNKLDNSIIILKQALLLAPSRIDVWQELANVQSMKGDYADAIESLTRAYDLNRDYLPSEFMLAKTYLLAGKKDEGFKFGLDAFRRGYNESDNLLWFGSYLKQSGKINDLINLLKLLSERNPNYLIYLALAYKDAGDINQSKQTADLLLYYEDAHPGTAIAKDNYNTLAELYRYFGDIKKRTRAFEKSGVL